MRTALQQSGAATNEAAHSELDWSRIAYLLLLSRAIDALEEERLLKERKLLYQFSARGHDLAQIILGSLLTHPHDAANGYYRSRPLVLSLGLDLVDALGSPIMRQGGFSDGRDIGVVFNLPNRDRPCVLPTCGGVGAQYTPVVGWAQAIGYRRDELGEDGYRGAVGVALGGDASVATNGFWSALTIATTERLPVVFYIEDNGYGISVPSEKQTPGCNIAANLQSFSNLLVLDGDGTEPDTVADLITRGITHARHDNGPALVRLSVPRLAGHSAQDTQAYKSAELMEQEWARDPLPKLKRFMIPGLLTEAEWQELENRVETDVNEALEQALARPQPDPAGIERYVFSERRADGTPELQLQGGLLPQGHTFPVGTETPTPEPERMNMLTAIRRTLDHELATNPKVLVFGEDVGPKGGVHAATMGLQDKFGERRVFDTSLSEEGIIGRSVGMALAGLMPVPEIQFRKYADPAEEQLNDCGTMRWRTANRFAAPMVVRMPVGFFKCGDPWHSQTGEVKWAHAVGWQVAMPSNAEDAVGLLRTALRDNNPTVFLEHRSMLDDAWARRPYPGDQFVVPFGTAKMLREGGDITVVSWGGMVARCDAASKSAGVDVELIDLRTLMPWDRAAVLESVRKTHRCLIVHEDNITAGFGAEIAAVLTSEVFFELDAPVRRLAMPDIPSPHSPLLLESVVPTAKSIAEAIRQLVEV